MQKEVDVDDTVLDLGCGIMPATLDTIPAYPKTRLDVRWIVGVDIYKPYLQFLRDIHIPVLHADLRQPIPVRSKSFDVVLLLDVLEHLSIDDAGKLLGEAERIARKKIMILTPSVFMRNVENVDAHGLGKNLHQLHRSCIKPAVLAGLGYVTQFHDVEDPHKPVFGVKCLETKFRVKA